MIYLRLDKIEHYLTEGSMLMPEHKLTEPENYC